MEENLIQIKKETIQWLDTLVINFNQLVMLRGWASDDEDYYWVFEIFGPNSKLEWSSCVLGFVPLKNILAPKDYLQFEKWFDLNRGFKYCPEKYEELMKNVNRE